MGKREAEGEGFEPSIRLTTDNGFETARKAAMCRDFGPDSPARSPAKVVLLAVR